MPTFQSRGPGEGISIVLKRSTRVLGPVIRSGNFSASSMSYDDFSYAMDSTNSLRSSFGRGSASASSYVDFGPRFHRRLISRKSDIKSYRYDPMNVKHRRSISSLSGASSHAFHHSSVGTSTLDSSEIPIIPMETYVADPASVVHRENQTYVFCSISESTSPIRSCVETTDVTEAQLDAISEGEVDQTCSSSFNASQSRVSQRSERSIEEFQDPPVSTALGNDIAVPATYCNNSNHSSSIIGHFGLARAHRL
ncbi:hypothetical protein Tco_0512497 [Tanacetum coccineum]